MSIVVAVLDGQEQRSVVTWPVMDLHRHRHRNRHHLPPPHPHLWTEEEEESKIVRHYLKSIVYSKVLAVAVKVIIPQKQQNRWISYDLGTID